MTSDDPHRTVNGTLWWRETLRALAGIAVFVVFALLVREHFGTARTWLADLGFWAPAAFVAVYVITVTFGFPVSVHGFLAGASFGIFFGTSLLIAGGLLAAVAMFVIARVFFAAQVNRFAMTRPRLARFLDLAAADSLRVMVLMRLSPLHFGLVSYLLGASRVRFLPYLVTTLLVAPSAALQAYMGHTVAQVGRRTAAGGSLASVETVVAAVGILAAVLLLVLIGQLARRALHLDDETTDGADEHA